MLGRRCWQLAMKKRKNKVPTERKRKLCGETKGVEEGIDENDFRGSAMWRKWRMIELLRGCMWVSGQTVAQ